MSNICKELLKINDKKENENSINQQFIKHIGVTNTHMQK